MIFIEKCLSSVFFGSPGRLNFLNFIAESKSLKDGGSRKCHLNSSVFLHSLPVATNDVEWKQWNMEFHDVQTLEARGREVDVWLMSGSVSNLAVLLFWQVCYSVLFMWFPGGTKGGYCGYSG